MVPTDGTSLLIVIIEHIHADDLKDAFCSKKRATNRNRKREK